MPRQRYVILGGGISGLALGWFLKQHYQDTIELTILEAANRPGGWIETTFKEGFLCEHGPRSFRPNGPGLATLQLIESLGLQDDYISAADAAQKRYLYTRNRLQVLPHNLFSFATSPFAIPLLKALWKDWKAPMGAAEDESIYHFAERRFGASVANTFFDPLISGIYAGDIEKLSLKACFPSLAQLEQRHRCIWRGAFATKEVDHQMALSPFVEKARHQGIFTLKHGAESLIHALAQRLNSDLRLGSPAQKITFEQGASVVHLLHGEQLTADKLFLALPPRALANLLEETSPIIPKILQAIPTTSVASINLGYNSPVLQNEGFGYLIPSKEKQRLLGVVWDSSAFPQQNTHPTQTRLTAMLGGVHFPDFNAYSNAQFVEWATQEIRLHMGISQKPDYIAIKRSVDAIPQYTVGHAKTVLELKEAIKTLPGDLTLLGNAFFGISVNDCVAHAQQTAQSTLLL